jgi:hypothetical protein
VQTKLTPVEASREGGLPPFPRIRSSGARRTIQSFFLFPAQGWRIHGGIPGARREKRQTAENVA